MERWHEEKRVTLLRTQVWTIVSEVTLSMIYIIDEMLNFDENYDFSFDAFVLG